MQNFTEWICPIPRMGTTPKRQSSSKLPGFPFRKKSTRCPERTEDVKDSRGIASDSGRLVRFGISPCPFHSGQAGWPRTMVDWVTRCQPFWRQRLFPKRRQKPRRSPIFQSRQSIPVTKKEVPLVHGGKDVKASQSPGKAFLSSLLRHMNPELPFIRPTAF